MTEVRREEPEVIDLEDDDEGSSSGDSAIVEGSTEQEDDSEEEDEEEGEGSSEESESSEFEDSDSDDSSDGAGSLWGDQAEKTTTISNEVEEARVMMDFQSGLKHLVEGRREKGEKIFYKLLKHRLVVPFHKTEIEWDSVVDERLSKMARIFVGCHKNIADLLEKDGAPPDQLIPHYVQILVCVPDNEAMWLKLGLKSFEIADLSMAKFALERASFYDAEESLIATHFFSREYHACLQRIHRAVNAGRSSAKLKFFKEKIREISTHYQQYCDGLFAEDRYYEFHEKPLDKKKILELETRLAEVNAKLREAADQRDKLIKPEEFSDLSLEIFPELRPHEVLTIFCDLFDRIESYSSLSQQHIDVSKWADREAFLDVASIVDDVVDVMETVDTIIDTVTSSGFRVNNGARMGEQEENDIRRSARRQDNETEPDMTTAVANEDDKDGSGPSSPQEGLLPFCKLAGSLHVVGHVLDSLVDRTRVVRTRTPTPVGEETCLNEEAFLTELRNNFLVQEQTRYNIWTLIEKSLMLLTELCPSRGCVSGNMLPVVTQLYRRLNLMCSNLSEERWIRLHLIMDELGEPWGREYTLRFHLEHCWPTREMALRFAWCHIRYSTDETIKEDFLTEIVSRMEPDECVLTATGVFCRVDVEIWLDRLMKKKRIASINGLAATKNYEDVVSILSRELDWNSVDEDEVLTMIGHLGKACIETERHEEACLLINRSLVYALEGDEILNDIMDVCVSLVDKLELVKVPHRSLSTLGYFLCRILSLSQYKTDWHNWKLLYRIQQQFDDDHVETFLAELNRKSDGTELPIRSLNVLMEAHESLGDAGCCNSEEDGFVMFMLRELHACVSNEKLMSLLERSEYEWLRENLNIEVYQALYCAYGRYGKKRRNADEHENVMELPKTAAMADIVVPLALPYPLPMYDDKERLGHDVVDLVQSKFPFLLKTTKERKKIGDKLDQWYKQCTACNDDSISDDWPCVEKTESELYANVWYVFALHHFRSSNLDEAKYFSKLFLTSGHATKDHRATGSVWVIMAHAAVSDLCQMDDDGVLDSWRWALIPFRAAIWLGEESENSIVHFQFASILYQISARLRRMYRRLVYDHWRRPQLIRALPELMSMAKRQLEKALALAQPAEDGTACEFQWLCYFYLAKIAWKEDYDVVKVADLLFESACSCELAKYYCPAKINVKKQSNIEPVEVHYQFFATVWKYLENVEQVSIATMTALLTYARMFQYHKVVRSSNTLFAQSHEVVDTMVQLSVRVSKQEDPKENDVQLVVSDLITATDLFDELWTMCYKGFQVICDRFPHMKAYFRLAQMELWRGRTGKAFHILMKNVFRKKKREEGLFEGIVEITSMDIDRTGSFSYHVERSVKMLMGTIIKLKDLETLLVLIETLLSIAGQGAEDHLLEPQHNPILFHSLKLLTRMASSEGLHAHKTEFAKLWETSEKYKEGRLLSKANLQLQKMIEKYFGSVANFKAKTQLAAAQKKMAGRKRKLTTYDLSREPAHKERGVSTGPISQMKRFPGFVRKQVPNFQANSTDDCQIVETPEALLQMAVQAMF